jgi:hypothetical protein
MSGLLNMGPQDEALLALGLGLLNSKGSFGNALGQAGMQSMQTLNQAKERERMSRQQALQEQMAQMQLQQVQRQQAEQQAAAERESQFRSRLAPIGPGQAASMPGGPTPQNAQQIGQGPDWQSLALQFPDKADLIAKLAGSKNFGRDEVKDFIETPDGKQGVSKYGDRVGTPFALPPDIQLINLGGKTVGVDKRKAAGQAFTHTQTPDSIASNAVAMRGQNMVDARAREALVNAKPSAAQEKADLDKQKTGRQSQQMLAAIDEARSLLSTNTTASGVGAGVDWIGRQVGVTSESAQNASKLETLAGWMVANVPRMEGPQSNFDVQNYQTMAAKVGNRNTPVAERQAALDTLEDLHRKYADINGTPLPERPSKAVAAPREFNYDPKTRTFK